MDTIALDYEQRVIAFVDLLGFAKLVTETDANPNVRGKISKLLAVNKLFEEFVRRYLDTAEAAFFSDTFILSMQPSDTLYVIREIGYLCRYLFWQGFPCRGAITTGSLYHRGRSIIGPALVKAYQLEQSVAVYPRVILDDTTVEHWKKEFGPDSPHPQLESWVKRDRDGQQFLNIFNPEWAPLLPWTAFVPGHEQMPRDPLKYLDEVRKHIGNGLIENRGNLKIVAKYEWLTSECSDSAVMLSGKAAIASSG